MPRSAKATRSYLIEAFYFDPNAPVFRGAKITRHAYRVDLRNKPSDADAEVMRQELNRSFQPGASNACMTERLGFQPHISTLSVRTANTGVHVATAKAPTFEVTG